MANERGTGQAARRREHDQDSTQQHQARTHDAHDGHDARLHAICERVRKDLGPTRFGRYLGQGARLETAGDSVEVVASSTFMAQVLDRNVVPALRRAIAAEGSEQRNIHVRVDRKLGTPPRPISSPSGVPAADQPAPRRPQRPTRPAGVSLRHRLDDFLVGSSNRLAHSAASRIAEGLDDAAFSPLFLHGPSGVGKTHLLEGIARRVLERVPGTRVRYVTAESFTNDFITAIQTRGMDKFRRAWRGVKLLCIDDVHFLRNKQSTQNELLHTLDAIGLRDARVVLASDEPPRKIAALSDQLVSRFMGGAVVRIDEPDDELCRRLLCALAARRGLTFTEDGISALMQRVIEQNRRNVREIEGLLTQVAAVRRLLPEEGDPAGPVGGPVGGPEGSASGPICAAGVRRALRASEGGEGTPARQKVRGPIRLDTIIGAVCEQVRVTTEDLFSRGRHRRVVIARGLIVRLARELTTMSYPEIARGMKRPNHSTVITAYNRIGRQIDAGEQAGCGPDLAGLTIADLLARLRAAVADSERR
ncbi:MAG: DnaA/Hda family protein [Planctomycetota bacterium]|nr:DnaA/Hda family protein [Planctomycetota bacterium]